MDEAYQTSSPIAFSEATSLPTPDGLHNILEQLQSSGQADSSGAFTITPEKAREKLRQFALPEPRLYVLNLLASAVASGASWVKVQLTASRLEFDHNGQASSERDLQNLWNQLLNPAEPRLHELAVALNAARALVPSELWLESWEGSSGWRLDLSGDAFVVEAVGRSAGASDTPHTRVVVQESAGLASVPRWWGVAPEQAALTGSGAFAPLDLIIKGRSVGQSVRVGRSSPTCAAWLHLTHPEVGLRVEPPDAEWNETCLIAAPRPSEDSFEAILSLDQPIVAQAEGLVILVNGIAFPRSQGVLSMPFVSGVVAANDLRKNLSHTGLVEDDRYKTLLSRIVTHAEDLLVERMESGLPLSEALTSNFLGWVPQLSQRLDDRGLPEKRSAVERWVLEVRFAQNLQKPAYWTPLRDELIALGTGPAGQALESRLVQAISQAVKGYVDTGRLLQADRLWGVLVDIGTLRQTEWSEQASQTWLVLRALSGVANKPSLCTDPEIRAALLRLAGNPTQALDLHLCPLSLGQALLALEQFEPAETYLRTACEQIQSPMAAEALSDCLAFVPSATGEGRKEALRWRELAYNQRAGQWSSCHTFLLEDLAILAKSTLPLVDWVRYRVRVVAAWCSEADAARQIDQDLAKGRALLRRGGPGAVAIKTTLMVAESKFAPSHSFMDAARSRAAHILREVGLWAEADDILARGDLLRSLQFDNIASARESPLEM